MRRWRDSVPVKVTFDLWNEFSFHEETFVYIYCLILDGGNVDWEYCEREQDHVLLSRRMAGAPQVYAPDRGPPILDFLFVLTAFFAAIFAAFYTILSETGVHKK